MRRRRLHRPREDGTTTGEIFVAEGGEGGGDLDEDLTADTFIRDLEFTRTRISWRERIPSTM
jgi:hypothetical protein